MLYIYKNGQDNGFQICKVIRQKYGAMQDKNGLK